jgi:methylglutaconyl-CoA hydratase
MHNDIMHPVLREDHGNVRVLALNRPEVRNALSRTLRDTLQAELDEAKRDPAVRAVIITGTGNVFCAGLDLSELQSIVSRSTEENREDSAALASLFESIYLFPKPVVAAVNGHAIGGGAGLASICDLVIMSEDAKIGYTESRIGFVAALVGVFLVRQVGEKHARDLLLSARLIQPLKPEPWGSSTKHNPQRTCFFALWNAPRKSSPTPRVPSP